MSKDKVEIINCQECPYGWASSAVQFSPFCKKHVSELKYDLLILKNKYFNKSYDKNNKLTGIEPFFMDVRLGTVSKDGILKHFYELPTGAKVGIFETKYGSENIYHIRVNETNIPFKQLPSLYKEVESYMKKGTTNNPIIKTWYEEFGIIKHLLSDPDVLEININPPSYKVPVRITHSEYEECSSNIYVSQDFLNYLETRLKIISGRPLNKAEPRLDSELVIGNYKARIAAIIDPFSISGPAFSIRKHRNNPWTIQLFMKNKSVNEWFAGLMSLAVDNGRTILTAGPRGSGKTSLLGALVLEILPKYRIITIEDTQELPIESYQKLDFDIVPLKVRSALLKEGMEITFESGLRTSLRLGDSCLIIGEIRGKEATVLYEAMRVGAESNTVAGTIHADSPYGVYDRVVNDLGVPKGSFKVTDLIVIQNHIKTPSGLKRLKRVVSVTEVLKDWEDKPQFQDLLVYNSKTDELEPTEILLNGKSEFIKKILNNSKVFNNYQEIIDEIILRGEYKKKTLEYGKKFLEAKYVRDFNIIFKKVYESCPPFGPENSESDFRLKLYEELDDYILRNADD